jgi:hypothetical protein
MWIVRMICSAPECVEEVEAVVSDLHELERFGCTCGHGLVLMSVSEVELARA